MLRLICMWFVVCIHYVGWGGIAGADNVPVLNLAFSGGVAVAFNCAVNCFYMISGYFISGNETLQRIGRRALKVWVPTFLYSVTIPLLLLAVGAISMSGNQIAYLFFPIIGNQYWFSTVFIAMTMLLPYIGKALCRCSEKELVILCGLLLFFDAIQPMGVNAFANIGYGILHAATMYVIGYAIKCFSWRIKSIHAVLIYAGCVSIIGAITILSMELTGDRNRTIADYNSILMIVQFVALFMFFLNLNISKIRFSKLAPYVFGVYLLNDNQYAREFLWHKVFHTDEYYASPMMPVHFLVSTIAFLMVAMAVEYLRINLWKMIRGRACTWLI